MALSPLAASTLEMEARALVTRLSRAKPFALIMPMLAAANVGAVTSGSIERYLMKGRRELRRLAKAYLGWLKSRAGRQSSAAEAQRRLSFLRLKFNAVLTQLDIFADALTQRGEHDNGVWLAGLDVVAADALVLPGRPFEPPPVMIYLDRGHGAAIRRARTRLPGGGENPVAIIRIPRERMVGSGIASSLVHEVGHQGAALLGLVDSLRQALRTEQSRHQGDQHLAWGLWERWISEIVADLWSVAKVGVAATQGLMGVVSLPRAFVFRIHVDDPHPFPWIRVKLSAAAGEQLYPHPQWDQLARLWESFYPREGLAARSLRIIQALEATLPAFVRLLLAHRPQALRGKTLHQGFPTGERQPRQLRALFQVWRSSSQEMHKALPTVFFAALGQAKQDRKLGPELESRMVADQLNRWALRRALAAPDRAVVRPRARAA
jgi:hypothetical protein